MWICAETAAESVWTVVRLWPLAVLTAALVVSAITDLRDHKIYNSVTYPAMVVGLVGHAVFGGWTGTADSPLGLAGAVLGLVVGFGPMLLLWKAGLVNGGDAKLVGAIGALGGMWFAISSLFYGLIVAAVWAIVLIVARGVFLETFARIGRFAYVSAASGRKAEDPSRPESPKVPQGVALSIGAAAALIEFLLRDGRGLLELR